MNFLNNSSEKHLLSLLNNCKMRKSGMDHVNGAKGVVRGYKIDKMGIDKTGSSGRRRRVPLFTTARRLLDG